MEGETVTRRRARSSDAINYQIHMGGKGLSELSHEALTELVLRTLDGQRPPEGIDIRIQAWRAGQELAWWQDNPRAAVLRNTIRRLLQNGRLTLPFRGSER